MADIFEEVDEDLKQENYRKLWERYGRYLIALMVLIVAGTAAYVGWNKYVQKRQIGYSDRFIAAIDQAQAGHEKEAAAAMAELAGDANAGYAMLARFREASLRRKSGDTAAAVDIYETLASDTSIDPAYRSLATLLSVMAQVDTGDPAALSAKLKPIATDSPWRNTANEYLGVLALRQGDVAGARSHFQAVSDDATAPAGARARAAELLKTLAQ